MDRIRQYLQGEEAATVIGYSLMAGSVVLVVVGVLASLAVTR